MACCSSSSSYSPSSSSSNPPKYDVFLSFRGEDTRKNFTSYLYDALCRKQIETFIDNNELKRGDEISPSLSRAIQDSSIAIIIFSQNYASSTWCLNELLEILECMKTKGQIVLPVFYRVTPSEIRKQTGSYKTAFAEHEKRFKKTKDKVRNWRAALTQVANLSGWDLSQHDGTESDFVEKIAKDVLKRLNHMSSIDYFEGLVGIMSRIEAIESLLCIGMKNIVRIIGIWGMGGIGKTTIARAILIRIANQFESHCFLANVKDVAKYGPNHSQEKILNGVFEDRNVHINAFTLNRLRRKKVLIVLDDVDDLDHIDFLVRGHSSFGAGSRIIITSRDKQVLKNSVDELYEIKELNYHEALKLFSANAFKQNYPPENYTELSNRVIGYAKGNPLALKVLGRFLFDRSKLEWKSSLNKLKRCPNLKIQNVLKISYDGLDYKEKEIFLSIACFFKGEYKDRVVALLNDCGFYAEIGMAVLVDKCLLTITDDLLMMHDLIQEMGRGIVLQQSFDEPNKRSKLWDPQDVFVLFKKNIGTNIVESISLDLSQIRELQLSPDAFTKMTGLKFLKFYSSEYHEGYSEEDRVHLLQGLDSLPEDLRYLHWHRYPLKSLPSNFNPERLVELEMPHSNVEHLLTENQSLENLRRIDLSYSQNLIEAPNISQVPNLQTVILHGCSSLSKLPRFSCNVKNLYLSHTAIEEIPSAIESLNKLVTLKLENCTRLKNLPNTIRHLTSLKKLDLSGCSGITEFPNVSKNVQYLLLEETAIEEVPSSVEHLTTLSQLTLRNCTRLKGVSRGIFTLELMNYLSFEGCSKLDNLAIKEGPSSIENILPRLSRLDMGYCKNIQSFPIIFCNLRSLYRLDLAGYSGVDKMLEKLPLSSSSGLCSLHELNLSECNLFVLPSSLSCLSSLMSLDLSGNNFESLSLKSFSSLIILKINYCKRLKSLQDLPLPSSLANVQAHHCTSLETLPNSNVVFMGNWDCYHHFNYSNCFKLNENARLSILADVQLRIQFMANNNGRGTTSTDDYPAKRKQRCSVSFCFPGNEIPEWIEDQSDGSSITVDLPPRWYSNKFFGFALCIIAAFEDSNDLEDFFIEWKCNFIDNDDEWHEVVCHVDNVTITHPVSNCATFGRPKSEHVFFVAPNHELYEVYEENDDDDKDKGDDKGDSSFSIEKYSSCEEAFFQFSLLDSDLCPLPNCKVSNCGVRLLYAEDLESIEGPDEIVSSRDQIERVERERDDISNVEEEDPNLETNLELEDDHGHCNCLLQNCFSFLFQGWN